jgi:hypothetical protein
MKIVVALAAALLLLGFAQEVVAEKLAVQVTPGSTVTAEGISVRTERRGDGHIEFTVRRDPAKAQYHDRGATLQVNGPAGLVAKCSVQGSQDKQHMLYHFVVAPSHTEHSEFVLSEYSDGKLIGGGTIYTVRLKDFVPQDKDPAKKGK